MAKAKTNAPTVRVSKLKPYANNARTHSPRQIEQIKKSIEEFGFVNPILIDAKFNVIAGHGRLEAAIALGMVEVPAIDVRGLTEKQKRAYILADNQLALNAGWDFAYLDSELGFLNDAGFDVGLIGFDTKIVEKLNVGIGVFPDLPTTKSDYIDRTFYMHEEQVAVLDRVLEKARNLKVKESTARSGDNRTTSTLVGILLEWEAVADGTR